MVLWWPGSIDVEITSNEERGALSRAPAFNFISRAEARHNPQTHLEHNNSNFSNVTADMASNGVPAPVAAVPAPKKKSLFNRRPKVTKPVATEEDDVDFFSRARDLFPQTIQDEERKKERRQARLERKRTTESVERKASKTPEVKRRRISELQDGHHSSDSSPLQEVDDDGAEMSFTHKLVMFWVITVELPGLMVA